MIDCTVTLEKFDELERLHMDLAAAPVGEAWAYQARLVRFIEENPTVLPYLIDAGREKRRENARAA